VKLKNEVSYHYNNISEFPHPLLVLHPGPPFLVLAISSYPQLHSVHYFISISLSFLPSFQVVRLYMSGIVSKRSG
jgi:hypothetical protein